MMQLERYLSHLRPYSSSDLSVILSLDLVSSDYQIDDIAVAGSVMPRIHAAGRNM